MNYRTSFLTFLRLFCLFGESVIQNYGTYPDQGDQLITDPLDPNQEHCFPYLYFIVMRSEHFRDIDKALAAEREAADLKEKEPEVQEERKEL